jgi:cyclic pyranopterin phosphate synthase
MEDFTHFNESGRARMVSVGEKEVSERRAVASAAVCLSKSTFELVKSGGLKKGDVLTTAQIGGIMGAKRTSDIIPMCHPVLINGVDIEFTLDETRHEIEVTARVSCSGKTGVEMEALSAVSIAALTIYDMCKAVQKDITITNIRLLEKTGGKSGDYHRRSETEREAEDDLGSS